jgi:hypothetical protein
MPHPPEKLFQKMDGGGGLANAATVEHKPSHISLVSRDYKNSHVSVIYFDVILKRYHSLGRISRICFCCDDETSVWRCGDVLTSGSRTLAAGEKMEILHSPDLVKKLHVGNVNSLKAIRDASEFKYPVRTAQ